MTKTQLHSLKIPEHIAIIMDGNGRWSAQKKTRIIGGHKAGAEVAREITKKAHQMGVKYLTLYTFSTENWSRPADWVNDLIGLLSHYLKNEMADLMANNVRFHVIGGRHEFGKNMVNLIEDLEEKTKHNTGLNLILALSYGGRAELTEAAKKIAQDVLDQTISIDQITPDFMSQKLYTHSFPDPDLLIRTSGEFRISNFLLWQLAYSEFIFSPKLWPDFTPADFEQAIFEYTKRDRRYGATIAA